MTDSSRPFCCNNCEDYIGCEFWQFSTSEVIPTNCPKINRPEVATWDDMKKHLNKLVKILPGDKRLKQLIKKHGDTWVVLKSDMNAQPCLPGAGYYVMSQDETHKRWVEEEYVIGLETAL